VTLALHPAMAGKSVDPVWPGFHMDKLEKRYAESAGNGITFISAPRNEHGILFANFPDSEGADRSAASN